MFARSAKTSVPTRAGSRKRTKKMLVNFLVTIGIVVGLLFVGHYVFERLREQEIAKEEWDRRVEAIRRLHDDDLRHL